MILLQSLVLYMLSFLSDASEIKFKHGEGYGTEWILFPDGDEVLHYVNLSLSTVPFARALDIIDIEYRLYTRHNPEEPILLDQSASPYSNQTTFNKTIFNGPIKILTHGWKSSADKSAVENIKNAYLQTKDVVVITIDWSGIAESYLYPMVAIQTQEIGHHVSLFLVALHEKYNVIGQNVHLIGHSLGAHVMGNAASETKFIIGRITGLDPARPLFEFPSRPNSVKLDSSDALFVDVIHTCSGILGVKDPIGQADFFPNNGDAPQPGCFQHIFEACSHSRSHFYFAESIKNPTAFPAHRCENWDNFLKRSQCDQFVFMGEDVNQNITGKFYLITNSDIPYGRGLIL